MLIQDGHVFICPSKVPSETALAVPLVQPETGSARQIPFLSSPVLSANQSWVVLIQGKLIVLLHLHGKSFLPLHDQTHPFQNPLQTGRAEAKCHNVRKLTRRYIWTDSYLCRNNRGKKRSQPQQRKKTASKSKVLLTQGSREELLHSATLGKQQLQFCRFIY